MDYEIIKTFKGSPDGSTVVDFQAGETATEKELGPELVKAAQAEGWIKPADINTNPEDTHDGSTSQEDESPDVKPAKAQTPKPAKTPAKKTGS